MRHYEDEDDYRPKHKSRRKDDERDKVQKQQHHHHRRRHDDYSSSSSSSSVSSADSRWKRRQHLFHFKDDLSRQKKKMRKSERNTTDEDENYERHRYRSKQVHRRKSRLSDDADEQQQHHHLDYDKNKERAVDDNNDGNKEFDSNWWQDWVHQQKAEDQEKRMHGWSYDPKTKYYFNRQGVWYDPLSQRYYDSKTGMYHDLKTGVTYPSNHDVNASSSDKKPTKKTMVKCEERVVHVTIDGITVGRSSLCGIGAKGYGVSRVHCEISYRRGKFVLKDVSKHGTVINDKQLKRDEQTGALEVGDVVRVCETVLRVRQLQDGRRQIDDREPMLLLDVWREKLVGGSEDEDEVEVQKSLQGEGDEDDPQDAFAAFKSTVFQLCPPTRGKKGDYRNRAAERRKTEIEEEHEEERKMNTEIGDDNIGRRILKNIGWEAGQGLGANQQGIVAPLQPKANTGTRGLH